jgi:hypothetical protein
MATSPINTKTPRTLYSSQPVVKHGHRAGGWKSVKMKKELLLIGGVGGLAPIIVVLLGINASEYFSDFEWSVFVGWMVRAALLFVLGALFVYLNDESDKKKAFQLGVVAPALIQGYLTAADLRDVRDAGRADGATTSEQAEGTPNGATEFFIGSAYASDPNRKDGTGSQFFPGFWRGLTGSSTYSFAIVATLPTRESALDEARRYQKFEAPCTPRVYHLGDNQYVVQLGGNLLTTQAQQCVNAARISNLSPDAFVFNSLSPRSEDGRINLPD